MSALWPPAVESGRIFSWKPLANEFIDFRLVFTGRRVTHLDQQKRFEIKDASPGSLKEAEFALLFEEQALKAEFPQFQSTTRGSLASASFYLAALRSWVSAFFSTWWPSSAEFIKKCPWKSPSSDFWQLFTWLAPATEEESLLILPTFSLGSLWQEFPQLPQTYWIFPLYFTSLVKWNQLKKLQYWILWKAIEIAGWFFIHNYLMPSYLS